jgi:hypothetical protein
MSPDRVERTLDTLESKGAILRTLLGVAEALGFARSTAILHLKTSWAHALIRRLKMGVTSNQATASSKI